MLRLKTIIFNKFVRIILSLTIRERIPKDTIDIWSLFDGALQRMMLIIRDIVSKEMILC